MTSLRIVHSGASDIHQVSLSSHTSFIRSWHFFLLFLTLSDSVSQKKSRVTFYCSVFLPVPLISFSSLPPLHLFFISFFPTNYYVYFLLFPFFIIYISFSHPSSATLSSHTFRSVSYSQTLLFFLLHFSSSSPCPLS
jgi:hypothetical protein